jgi:prevent-host-death family protein
VRAKLFRFATSTTRYYAGLVRRAGEEGITVPELLRREAARLDAAVGCAVAIVARHVETNQTSLTSCLCYADHVKTVTSTEAKAKLNAILAEVARTGVSVTITSHGRPVAVLTPARPRPRKFGQLPALVVPDTFDEPLPDAEIAAWEGNS